MFIFNNFIESIKNTVTSTICINAHRLMPEDLLNNNTEMEVESVPSNESIDRSEPNLINNIHTFNGNNAIIYIRVSTLEQEIQAQKYSCESFCIQNNLNIKKIYIEKCSAYKNKSQPELYKLINENENTNLVIFSIDRFSRNIKIGNDFVQKLEKKKICLISVKENINLNTALGKHNFRIYINAAQYESELISERVKNSIKFKKANNLHIGQAPYGFKIENKKLVKDYKEAIVCKFIFQNLRKSISSEALSHELFKVLTAYEKDHSDFVPLLFTDEDDKYEYHTYQATTKVCISAKMLAEILNDYGIKKRNGVWSASKILRIRNTFPINELRNLRIN